MELRFDIFSRFELRKKYRTVQYGMIFLLLPALVSSDSQFSLPCGHSTALEERDNKRTGAGRMLLWVWFNILLFIMIKMDNCQTAIHNRQGR